MEKENLHKKIVAGWEVPAGMSEEQAWKEVNQKIGQGKVVAMPRRTNYLYWAGAVAAIAVFAFLVFSPSSSVTTVDVTAALAQHKHIVLPDGSEVELNAGSNIKYASEWTNERVVELQGEAFFQVKKGSRFSVKTTQGTVEVLGTSFNVKDREGVFDVECFTGKVGVSSGNERVEITPGQHVTLQNGKLAFTEPTGNRTWVNGQFVYTEEPLENVLSEVERQFNVKITRPSLEGRKYTGTFTTNSLNEALDLVCLPMGYQYSIDEEMNVVVLARN